MPATSSEADDGQVEPAVIDPAIPTSGTKLVSPSIELKQQISPHLFSSIGKQNERKTFPISEMSEKIKQSCMKRKMRAVVSICYL